MIQPNTTQAASSSSSAFTSASPSTDSSRQFTPSLSDDDFTQGDSTQNDFIQVGSSQVGSSQGDPIQGDPIQGDPIQVNFVTGLTQIWPNATTYERWNHIETVTRHVDMRFLSNTTKQLFQSSWTTVLEAYMDIAGMGHQHVAIKIIPFGPEKKYTERQVQDEIFLLCMANLAEKEHTLPILSWRVNFEKSECVIITPYASLSLESHMKSLDSDSARLDVCIQVAQALEALAKVGIIHRSVRLGSVFIFDGSSCKLGNFGTSCIRGNEDSGQRNDFSSPLAAPELRESEDKTDCPAADVYSFGVLVWGVWTKFNPAEFRERSLASFGHYWDSKDLLPLPTQGCPPKIVNLIRQCWEQDCLRRPSFTQILQTLKEVDQELSSDGVSFDESVLFSDDSTI